MYNYHMHNLSEINALKFAKIVLTLFDACKALEREGLKPKKYHIWYLYRQSFYGFENYLDLGSKRQASVKADVMFKGILPFEDIRNKDWTDQQSFDPGRKVFILEHVFTGDMFRCMIDELPETQRTPESILDIVRNNYITAWILKTEDKKLGRSIRGKTLSDAKKYYLEKNIEIK